MSQCIGHCHASSNLNSSSMINVQADFSLNLLRQNGINSSTIFSPISITIALAMIFLGAKENTAAQIRNTIAKGVSGNDDEMHEYFSTFLNYSKKLKNIKLESANRIYVGNDFEILGSYIDGIKKFYNGEFEQINFNEPSKAANKINDFVAKSTHNKFQSVINPNSIHPLTRMISINAIYFKGEWKHPFCASDTIEAEFYSSPDTIKIVQMMSRKFRNTPYFENDKFEIIGLPYSNHEATMYIILPHERFGLKKIMQNIDASTFIEALKDPQQVYGNIKLPRFKIESTLNLADSLKQLGITNAFSERADFSGIAKNEGIKVSDMIQKAIIETNEESTEAAAVTISQHRVNRSTTTIYKDFIADHPFMFIIADKNLNFLFTGTFFG